jgi:hypothetical protein
VDISPTPHSRRPGRRRRRLAAVVGTTLLLGVALLLLAPLGLGMNHSVVRDAAMGQAWAPGVWRGSLALNDTVPGAELRSGDVISFVPPQRWSAEGPVTRRIVAVDSRGDAVTRGDAEADVDPWRVDLDAGSYSRLVLRVPWAGAVVDELGLWGVGGAGVALLAGSLLLARTGEAERSPARVPV